MDIHICGRCQSQYSTIEDFIQHKNTSCSADAIAETASSGSRPSQSFQNQIHDNGQPRRNASVPSVTTISDADLASVDCQVSSSTILSLEKTVKKKRQRKSEDPSVKTAQGRKGGGKPKVKQYVKQFRCTYDNCKFVTAHKKDLKRHNLTHTGEKPFPCQFCPKCFSRNDKRKLHERKHTNEKPFKCSIPACSYVCADGGSLKKHLRIHSDERPHQCQLCPYASRTASQLVVHLRRHTGDSPFHCQQCEAKFKTNTDLKRHMLIHTGEKPFACEECDYRSHLKCNLKSHIASNHRGKQKYQCEQCPHTCRTQRQLRKHVGDEHPKPAALRCTKCSFTTSRKDIFQLHRKKHSGQPPFQCQFCTFCAKQTRKLTLHMKEKHPEKATQPEKPKPAVNNKAKSKSVSRKDRPVRVKKRTLNVTMPIVDGKRPFKCADCSDSFVREDSFRSHRRQHRQLLEKTACGALSSENDQESSTENNQTLTNVLSDNIVASALFSTTEKNDRFAWNNESQRVVSSATCTLSKKTSLLDEGPSGKCSNPNEKSGDVNSAVMCKEVRHPGDTIGARQDCTPASGCSQEILRIIRTNKGVSVLGPCSAKNPRDNPLINVIPSSDKRQTALSTQSRDQAIKSKLSTQDVTAGSQSILGNSVIPVEGSLLQHNQGLTVQTSSFSNQKETEEHKRGQSAVVQSQTLGYGTANFPNLVFAPVVPPPQTPVILQSTPIGGQTILINDLTSQLQSRSTDAIPGNVTQAAGGSAVPGTIGGSPGGAVQMVYPNLLPMSHPVAAPSMLQQVVSQQQQQKELNVPTSQTPVCSTNAQVSAVVTYVATNSRYPPCAPVSTPRVSAVNQPQKGLAFQSSVPMGSFILNGRAISRGPPPADEVPSPNVSAHSQSLQR